jgi:hypothetical protein
MRYAPHHSFIHVTNFGQVQPRYLTPFDTPLREGYAGQAQGEFTIYNLRAP